MCIGEKFLIDDTIFNINLYIYKICVFLFFSSLLNRHTVVRVGLEMGGRRGGGERDHQGFERRYCCDPALFLALLFCVEGLDYTHTQQRTIIDCSPAETTAKLNVLLCEEAHRIIMCWFGPNCA